MEPWLQTLTPSLLPACIHAGFSQVLFLSLPMLILDICLSDVLPCYPLVVTRQHVTGFFHQVCQLGSRVAPMTTLARHFQMNKRKGGLHDSPRTP